MSASVADDMIRSFFERWQRLEEEKRTISDDLKELFAEARGNGLDTKALRAVFREQVGDKAAIEEFDAICDLYRASLNAPRAGRARESQSYAEAKGREPAAPNASNRKASNGKSAGTPAALTDTQEQPEEPATESVLASPRLTSLLAAREADESAAPHSPSVAPPADTVAEPQAPQAATVPHSNPQPNLLPGAVKAPEADSSPASGAALSDADVPAFLKPEQRKSIADYRPNCLNPDACGATGLQHCYTCRKAMEAASETEAA